MKPADTETRPVNVESLDVGLHFNVTSARYHADPAPAPSLSSGVARTILAKSLADAYHEHPKLGGKKKESTEAMGTGSLVHALLADKLGEDYEVGTYDNYRSAAARAWRDATTAAGKSPVLEHELDEARKIAASVRANVCNGGVTNTPFSPLGVSEAVAIWREGDAYCRAMFDRLVVDPNGYADVWDWKVTNDVTERGIEKSVAKYRYDIQAAFYLRGLVAVLPSHARRVSFTFCFVQDAHPYTIRRVCLSPEFLSIANRCASDAILKWRGALETNHWPDNSHETLTIDPPSFLWDDDISDSIAT